MSWRGPKGDLSIITFNQDLVLENVVARIPRTAGEWCLGSLYGNIGLDPLFNRARREGFMQHHPGCPHKPPVVIHKLHGSLNWGVRSSERDPKMGTLFPGRHRSRSIFVYDLKTTSDSARISTTTRTGRSTWYLWPLIVPPIYDKSRITGISVLRTDLESSSIRH